VKAAIIYHSKYGQTKKIALHIKEVLNSANIQCELTDVDSVSGSFCLDGFQAVLIGGPIYQSVHSKRLKKFVGENLSQLKQIPSAFFSVSLSAAGDANQCADATSCMSQFLESTGWSPTAKTIVAGSLPYRKYNWFTRLLMKWTVSRAGGDTDTSKNHEYTDWSELSRFATDFAATITGNRPPSNNAEHASLSQ
jgi:menaquinone-dependent protoporphyrinogen oxidase